MTGWSRRKLEAALFCRVCAYVCVLEAALFCRVCVCVCVFLAERRMELA